MLNLVFNFFAEFILGVILNFFGHKVDRIFRNPVMRVLLFLIAIGLLGVGIAVAQGIIAWFRTDPVTGVSVVLLIGAMLAAIPGSYFAWSKYRRFRPYPCPNCGTKMVRLSEDEDDLLLDDGERLEEALESVNYDVWQCPSCNNHAIHTYEARFTPGYEECPKCEYRTVGTSAKTMRSATVLRGGEERIVEKCHHCEYKRRFTVETPRLFSEDDFVD